MKMIKILLSILLLLCISFINSSFAHDTDLYMATGEGVEPNILILFDNSGSMDEEVQTRYYSNAITYDPLVVPTGNRDTVYRRSFGSWIFFANSINDILCAAARTALTNTGMYTGGTTATCSGTSRTLRTGNYRNYVASGGDLYERKIDIAKVVMTEFLNSINGVRIGAMVFNYDEGGHIQTTIKSLTDTGRAQLITDFNAIEPATWTPLAETLYEIGLYYKGASSYFNSGVTYTSPIQYSCQRNYVVIITDGNSTQDRNSILATAIGDRDGDQKEPIGAPNDPHYESNGSHYLDDVAKYLYETDLRSDLTGQQNIMTYTIGFVDLSNVELLERTAAHGHGKYFYAQNAQSLSNAFQNIIDEILSKTSSFVAPVVPVSRMERTTSGDKIYLALFKPVRDKMWSGNIKKYGIAQEVSGTINPGDVIDVNGLAALDSSGQFYETALSYWTTLGLDGGDAEKGGVGEVLMNRNFVSNPRKIYTYNTAVGNSNLTHSSNAFNKTNITPIMLGLGTDTSERDKLVDFVYGYDAYDDDGNGITNEKRDWILGAFLHSRPLIIHYGTTPTSQSVIFAGGNDGILHAFDDSTGEELWGFIPPNLLNKLQALHLDVLESFVDGSPRANVTRDTDGSINKAILVFGQRRGGNRFYALDITNPASPQYLWEINPDASGSPYVEMGETWSTPYIGKIAYGTGEKTVVFMGGGYDDGQDNDVPPADDKGRAIYVVDVLTGSLIKRFSIADIPAMTYSIPSDITRVDTDGNQKIDRLYVGDMGGRIWRVDITDPDPNNWTIKMIFTAPTGLKILYPPDVSLETSGEGDYEMIFIGTGDREHPNELTVVNRLYAIKDKNPSPPLTESDLLDVTDDLVQDLGEAKGWFIRLETGEKCLAPSLVLNKVAYYTTFTPPDESGGGSDPCYVGEGIAKVYALQYQTGNAAFNFDLTNDDGGTTVISTTDRSKDIGVGMPSGVVVTWIGGKGVIYIGVGGGVDKLDPHARQREPKYWRMIF
jgi:type IV pilus assembly protein PilY1